MSILIWIPSAGHGYAKRCWPPMRNMPGLSGWGDLPARCHNFNKELAMTRRLLLGLSTVLLIVFVCAASARLLLRPWIDLPDFTGGLRGKH